LCGSCANLPDLKLPNILLATAAVDRTLAVLDVDELDNSHPFIAPKPDRSGQTRRPAERVRQGTNTDGGVAPDTPGQSGPTAPPAGPPPGDQAGDQPGAPADDPADDGADDPTGVTGGDPTGPTGTAGSQPGEQVEETAKTVKGNVTDITDGLSGVVETLVPDPVLGVKVDVDIDGDSLIP